MRGTMLDMYRCPDKLLRACEMMCRIQLERIAQLPQATEFMPAFMPLHRGAHGFMSLKQFEIFYWPYLLTVINASTDKGYTPDVFFEGDYNSRLEYLAQLPKGKAIARFDQIDMARAKEILGKTVCIAGNMPVSILQVGTEDDVKKKCKELIDAAGKDGGYILAPASALDEVNPENMKTMDRVYEGVWEISVGFRCMSPKSFQGSFRCYVLLLAASNLGMSGFYALWNHCR